MADLYTNNPMTQKVAQARSVFGDNPADVKAGVASNMTQSAPFQDTLQSQGNALSAMDQIAAYDQELAAKYQAGNQQAMQQGQQTTANLAAFGSAGATPQDTILKGQQAIPATTYQTPVNGFLSPFVASGLATGQQNANTDVFNMATQTRSALQSAIGSEAEAYADALKYVLAEEQRKAEEERLLQEAQAQEAQDKFERELELVKLTGGTIVNPNDGKTYTIPAPKTVKEGTFDIQAALSLIKGNKTTAPTAPAVRPPLSSFEIPEVASPSKNAEASASLVKPFIMRGQKVGNQGGGAG